MADVPKKRGALAAMLSFGGKSSDPPEEADGSRYSRDEEPPDTATDEEPDTVTASWAAYASAAGIPKEKSAGACEALKRFVQAVSAAGDDDTTEE